MRRLHEPASTTDPRHPGSSPTGTPGKQTLVEQLVRRRVIAGVDAAGAAEVPDAVARARGAGTGAPLPSADRARLEHSFGVDLADVRLHRGAPAAEAAQAVGAQAFTTGRDIFIGSGGADFELLAHEVAHTVQGGGGSGVGAANAPEEAEADRAAAAAVRGAPAALAAGEGSAVIRRRPTLGAIGQTLGSVSVTSGPETDGRALAAVAELTPSDQPAAQFEGYTSAIQAVLRARQVATISVVVRDPDGRFHAFDTGLTPLPTRARDGGAWHETRAMNAVPGVFESVRVVRLYEEDAIDFTATRDQASTDFARARNPEVHEPGLYGRAEAGYERELRAIAGNDVAVGHRRTGIDDTNTDTPGAEVIIDVQPTNTSGAFALGTAGMVGGLPAERDAADPAVHHPVLAREGIGGTDDTQSAVEQLIIHEATHEAHAHRILALRHRWQASGGRADFSTWLTREAAAGRISAEDAALAQQASSQRAHETSGTEILARVEAFTSTFHRYPPTETAAFEQLATMATYWTAIASEPAAIAAVETIKSQAADRLYHYYAHGMDEAHRAAFDAWVADGNHLGTGAGLRTDLADRGRATLAPLLQGFRGRFQAEGAR